MFREENENHSPESAPQSISQQQQQDKPDPQDFKTMYRESGGGQRGAKYRMFLTDGFCEETAWYFSGPEYREAMQRKDKEMRLGIKHCKECDQELPQPKEPEEKKEPDEKEARWIADMKIAYSMFGIGGKRGGKYRMGLACGMDEDSAWYFASPEWSAICERRNEEERLGIERCDECRQVLPSYHDAYKEMMARLENI